MSYIIKPLRLTNAGLIERWERLVGHLQDLPQRPAARLYASSLTETTVTVVRAPYQPGMVFINVINDEDIDVQSDEQAELLLERGIVTREYKIDLKTPFIMSTIEVLNTADATRRWQTFHALVESVRRMPPAGQHRPVDADGGGTRLAAPLP